MVSNYHKFGCDCDCSGDDIITTINNSYGDVKKRFIHYVRGTGANATYINSQKKNNCIYPMDSHLAVKVAGFYARDGVNNKGYYGNLWQYMKYIGTGTIVNCSTKAIFDAENYTVGYFYDSSSTEGWSYIAIPSNAILYADATNEKLFVEDGTEDEDAYAEYIDSIIDLKALLVSDDNAECESGYWRELWTDQNPNNVESADDYGATNTALTAETTARTAADTTLQTNINTEATTRASADTALGTRIDNIIATSETSSTEVVDARTNHNGSALTLYGRIKELGHGTGNIYKWSCAWGTLKDIHTGRGEYYYSIEDLPVNVDYGDILYFWWEDVDETTTRSWSGAVSSNLYQSYKKNPTESGVSCGNISQDYTKSSPMVFYVNPRLISTNPSAPFLMISGYKNNVADIPDDTTLNLIIRKGYSQSAYDSEYKQGQFYVDTNYMYQGKEVTITNGVVTEGSNYVFEISKNSSFWTSGKYGRNNFTLATMLTNGGWTVGTGTCADYQYVETTGLVYGDSNTYVRINLPNDYMIAIGYTSTAENPAIYTLHTSNWSEFARGIKDLRMFEVIAFNPMYGSDGYNRIIRTMYTTWYDSICTRYQNGRYNMPVLYGNNDLTTYDIYTCKKNTTDVILKLPTLTFSDGNLRYDTSIWSSSVSDRIACTNSGFTVCSSLDELDYPTTSSSTFRVGYYFDSTNNNHYFRLTGAYTLAWSPMSKRIFMATEQESKNYWLRQAGLIRLLTTSHGGYATGGYFFEYINSLKAQSLYENKDSGNKTNFPNGGFVGYDSYDCSTAYKTFNNLNRGMYDTTQGYTAYDCDDFVFFTDPHDCMGTMGWDYSSSSGNALRRYQYTEMIAQAENAINADFVMCGGDLTDGGLADEEHTKVTRRLKEFEKSFNNFHYVLGNHDTNYQGKLDSSSSTYTGRYSIKFMAEKFFKSNKTYYTFKSKNARVYGFDTEIETSSDGANEQQTWFANQLIANDDAHAIMFSHIFYHNHTSKAMNPIATALKSVVTAYNSRNSAFTDNNGNAHDFSDCTGRIEIWIVGHSHADWIDYTGTTANDIPVVATISTGYTSDSSYGGSAVANFDLVNVQYNDRRAKFIRCGNQGADRTVYLDYSNKENNVGTQL